MAILVGGCRRQAGAGCHALRVAHPAGSEIYQVNFDRDVSLDSTLVVR